MAGVGQGQADPLRVVSVSLGSSKSDHSVEVEMLGRRVRLERIGVDNDYQRACARIAELDGKVAAIGLGGTDLYLVAGRKRYVIEESRRLAESAKVTPVVDGSGLKNTLERETIRWLAGTGTVPLAGKKVLLVCAVDRFGMAESLVEVGAEVIFGDLIFAVGLPVPIRSLRALRAYAAVTLPVVRRLPMRIFYPAVTLDENRRPRGGRYFAWADVVAGDFKYIHRHLPPRLEGKVVITNTTTAADVARLRDRGVSLLVTTTPEYAGRSFGTNVIEAALVALAGKRPEEMQPDDYLHLLRELQWQPRVTPLAAAEPGGDRR